MQDQGYVRMLKMLEVLASGPPNLGALVRDCKIHVDKMQRLGLGIEMLMSFIKG